MGITLQKGGNVSLAKAAGAPLTKLSIGLGWDVRSTTGADFDLDAISDLRMAVDEACATLVDAADPTSVLQCRFLVRPERIRVHAEVEAAKADAVLSTDTFGWRVLQTLADDVEVLHDDGGEGRRPTVGIRLDKSAGDVPR